MTLVKICGITNLKEIGYLNKYLPDYAGFVFARSRRQVTVEQATDLAKKLAPSIRTVGVFVDHEIEQVAEIAGKVELHAVQLHGNEDGGYIQRLRPLLGKGIEIWKALRIDAFHMPGPELLGLRGVDRILLDTYVDGSHGGTGKCFDWKLVSQLDTALPVVLAGGLNPDNVTLAVKMVSPFAVDTSSGVESEGMKDEGKLKAFIEAVRGGKV